MPSVVLVMQAVEEGHESALPLPAWVFGVLVLAVFLLLLLATWLFRHTAQAYIEDRRGRGYTPHGHGAHGHGEPRHGRAEGP